MSRIENIGGADLPRAMLVFIRFVEFKNMITLATMPKMLVIRHGLLHMGEKDNLMYTSNRSWSLHDDYDRCAG